MVPIPASVAPEATVTRLVDDVLPLMTSVPSLTVVFPV